MIKNFQNDDVLNLKQVAEFLSTPASYIYKLTMKGLIPHYKPSGKKLFFLKSEVLEWLTKCPILSAEAIEQKAIDYVANNPKGA